MQVQTEMLSRSTGLFSLICFAVKVGLAFTCLFIIQMVQGETMEWVPHPWQWKGTSCLTVALNLAIRYWTDQWFKLVCWTISWVLGSNLWHFITLMMSSSPVWGFLTMHWKMWQNVAAWKKKIMGLNRIERAAQPTLVRDNAALSHYFACWAYWGEEEEVAM